MRTPSKTREPARTRPPAAPADRQPALKEAVARLLAALGVRDERTDGQPR
jgi:hypothetical protein